MYKINKHEMCAHFGTFIVLLFIKVLIQLQYSIFKITTFCIYLKYINLKFTANTNVFN